MTDWATWIGNSSNMQAKSVAEALGKEFKYGLLARRDGIHADLSDQYGDEYEDPYFRFETLEQLNNPKTKDDDPPYYTYEFEELVIVKKDGKSVKVKDPETGKMVVKKEKDKGPHKVKSFVTVGGDLKLFLLFLFNKYMEEAYQCYLHNKKSFDEPEQVLSQVRSFVENNYGVPPISNFIVDIVDLIPVDEFVDDDEIPKINKTETLEEYLIKQAKITFKDDKGGSPNRQLKKIIDKFIRFVQLMSVMYMDQIWGKNPSTMHIKDVIGVIRQLYIVLRSEGHEFQYGIYQSAEQWVEESLENAKKLKEENAKKKAEEKKSGKSTKKAGSKSTSSTKKGAKKAPAKKGKKKEKTPEPSDEEEENEDEVDEAMDELGSEDEAAPSQEDEPSQEEVEYESEQEFDE